MLERELDVEDLEKSGSIFSQSADDSSVEAMIGAIDAYF